MGEEPASRIILFCFLQRIQITHSALKGFNGGAQTN